MGKPSGSNRRATQHTPRRASRPLAFAGLSYVKAFPVPAVPFAPISHTGSFPLSSPFLASLIFWLSPWTSSERNWTYAVCGPPRSRTPAVPCKHFDAMSPTVGAQSTCQPSSLERPVCPRVPHASQLLKG